jgi:two-component system response regulator
MRELLLIEDSKSDAELLEAALRAAKVANPVRHMMDGAQAMAFLKARENSAPVAQGEIPSVLLLDLRLPRANGFEILGYLQMSFAFSEMLKVVVSDLTYIEDIRTAYAMGAQAFLSKPVHRQDVEELVTRYPTHWELLRGSTKFKV